MTEEIPITKLINPYRGYGIALMIGAGAGWMVSALANTCWKNTCGVNYPLAAFLLALAAIGVYLFTKKA